MIGYIPDDTVSITGKMNEAPGLYPETTIKFRCMTAQEYGRMLDKSKKLTEEQMTMLQAAEIVTRLKSWSVVDHKGTPVIISEQSVLRLPQLRFARLWCIVAGIEGPDSIEGQTPAENASDFDSILQATRENRMPGQVKTENDLKN